MNTIINLITSIRNAKNAKLGYIAYSINQKERQTEIIVILTILRNNGVIRAFTYAPSIKSTKFIIFMKYDQAGNSVIRSIFSISKPSRSLHISSKALWQPQSITGFFVLSTTYGIITDIDARRHNVGGCILFGVT